MKSSIYGSSNRINNSPIDYGHCDRCNCALIQYSPDDMCMVCEDNMDTIWDVKHKEKHSDMM